MTLEIELHIDLKPEWSQLPIIRSGKGGYDYFTLVSENGKPLCSIGLNDHGVDIFRDAVIWKHWVVVGLGDAAYFTDVKTHQSIAHPLDRYYGSMFVSDTYILLASATNLLKVDTQAAVVWASNEVGIDGVIVQKVEQGIITGIGEWDPPGDWREFRLDIETGKSL